MQLIVPAGTLTSFKYFRNSNPVIQPCSLCHLRQSRLAIISCSALDKYAKANAPAPLPPTTRNGGLGNGTFSLLLLNFAVFLGAPYFMGPRIHGMLALNHLHPHWWQFFSAAFCHANWDHLLGNAFSLLVFGRMVEEEEGALGVLITYLVCGALGNVASLLSAPTSPALSLGASGAVFGLFIVATLLKFRLSIKKLLEAFVLGSFVVKQVLGEVSMVSTGKGAVLGGMQVGHWAHLGGAAAGVLLVLLLSRLPVASASSDYYD